MMTIYAISDLHFGHTNCIFKFKEPDGSMMRGEFTDQDPEKATLRMNETIVERINGTVRVQDHLYVVGDVAMRRGDLAWVKRLHCRHMTLIGGNHDIFSLKDYLNAGFKEVRGMRVLSNVAFTHVPMHPACLGRFIGNAHGHIHRRPSPEGPYFNLSCEVLDYTPVTLEDIVIALAALNPDKDVHISEVSRMKDLSEEIELIGADE